MGFPCNLAGALAQRKISSSLGTPSTMNFSGCFLIFYWILNKVADHREVCHLWGCGRAKRSVLKVVVNQGPGFAWDGSAMTACRELSMQMQIQLAISTSGHGSNTWSNGTYRSCCSTEERTMKRMVSLCERWGTRLLCCKLSIRRCWFSIATHLQVWCLWRN